MKLSVENRNYLVCPVCREPLQYESTDFTCGTHKFSIKNGYISFSEHDFYYGEIPRQEMQTLLQEIKDDDYSTAIASFFQIQKNVQQADYLYRYLFDPCRYSWQYLTGLTKRRRVLDIGCGWGTLLLPLARYFDKAVGMDMTAERLEFSALRAEYEGVTNVTLIKGGAKLPLPFADGSFDLVVLNGVLEWVPESASGNPREVQRRFLMEIKRILSPAGEVYIGIENRLAYTYFMGKPEDHTALRFGALLPRPLANLYSLVRRQKPYRTYTYGRAGYASLLKQAGFTETRMYPVYPDYRFPSRFIFSRIRDSFDKDILLFNRSKRQFKHRIRQVLLPVADKTGFLDRLAHSFSIVSGTTAKTPFVAGVLSRHGFSLSDACAGIVTDAEALAVIVRRNDSLGAVFKFPLTARSLDRMHKAEHSVRFLHDKTLKMYSSMKALIPLQQVSEFAGLHYSFASLIPGKNLLQEDFHPAYEEQAVQFLNNFHALESKHHILTQDRLIQMLIDENEQYFTVINSMGSGLATSLRPALETVAQRLAGISVNFGYCHRDYHAGNILVDKGKISGVIDWDMFCPDGVQALDQLHYEIFKSSIIRNKLTSQIIYERLIEPQNEEYLLYNILFLLKLFRLYINLTNALYVSKEIIKFWEMSVKQINKNLKIGTI